MAICVYVSQSRRQPIKGRQDIEDSYSQEVAKGSWRKGIQECHQIMLDLCHILYIAQQDFFLYPISLPSGSKEQMIFSRTRKDFTAAKPQHKKAHSTPKKDFRLIFFCLWSENSSKRKKAPQLQGHNCSIGQHTRIQLDCHCLQQQTED